MKRFIIMFMCTIAVFMLYAQTLEYQSKWLLDIKGKTSLAENETKSKQITCTTPDKGVIGLSGFKDYAKIDNKNIYHKGDFKLIFKIDSLGKLVWHKVLVDSFNSAIGFGSFLRVDKSGNIYILMSQKVTADGANWPTDVGGLICLSPKGDYKWSKKNFTSTQLESNYFENQMYNYSEFKGVFVYQPVEFMVSARYGIITPEGQFNPFNTDYKNLPYQTVIYYHPFRNEVYFLGEFSPESEWKIDSVLTIPADKSEKSRRCLLRMDSLGAMHLIGTFHNHQYIPPKSRFCASRPNRLFIGFSYRANDTLWYNNQFLGLSNSALNPAQICLDRNGKLVWFSECDFNYFGGSTSFVFEESIRNGKLISLYNFYDNTTGMYWDGLQQEGGGQFLVTLDTATGKATRLMKTFFYGRLSMLSETKYAELILLDESIDLNGTTYYPTDSINRFFIAFADTFTKPNAIAENKKTLAKVYPNPSINTFYLDWELHSFATATIYNANGILMKEINQGENANFGMDWPSGVYIVKITDKKGSSSMVKIIKMDTAYF